MDNELQYSLYYRDFDRSTMSLQAELSKW